MERGLSGRVWRVAAALASLGIFLAYVVDGRWQDGLLFAVGSALFVLNTGIKTPAPLGLSLLGWLTLILMGCFGLFCLYLAGHEAIDERPYHVQLAVTVLIMGSMYGSLAVIATIRILRMARDSRA